MFVKNLVLILSIVFCSNVAANLKCEELINQRTCLNNAPKSHSTANGTIQVPAPHLPGTSQACWSWSRVYQCVETNPIYSCDSGTNYDVVKQDCNLTKASTLASITIKGLTYITDARYTYACEFGGWTNPTPPPPADAVECVELKIPAGEIKDTKTISAAATGVDASTATLNQNLVSEQELKTRFACYKNPVTSCSQTCSVQVDGPAPGEKHYVQQACPATQLTGCVLSSDSCNITDVLDPDTQQPTGAKQSALGPDGRCVSSSANSLCQSGPIPQCLTQGNCVLSSTSRAGILASGIASQQSQDYLCSTETRSCAKTATVSTCFSPNAWGMDQRDDGTTDAAPGLGDANNAMAKLDGMSKGMTTESPFIFSGTDKRCHFAVGNFTNTLFAVAVSVAVSVATAGTSTSLLAPALSSLGVSASFASSLAIVSQTLTVANDVVNSRAFGNDCCKDFVIEGSDAWYKVGAACTGDEVKLSVGRRKALTVYLGEFCSKKGGFPFRSCVQRSRSFCLFDDILALTVNEQGRAQLDEIAIADPGSTVSTGELSFRLYAQSSGSGSGYTGLATGHWVKDAVTNGSQIWHWEYPAYCASAATTKAAHDLYQAEVKSAFDTKGIQPEHMTKAQAAALLNKIGQIPHFQECPALEGHLPVMTCAAGGCDESKLPAYPSGAEVDVNGDVLQLSDPNWRVQLVKTLYSPGSFGIGAVMASDASFAASIASVSPLVSFIGSCHSDGACLARYAVTQQGPGARKRVKERVTFPLYNYKQSADLPTVDYVGKTGELNSSAWQADPNRGAGTPRRIGQQNFIFRPNFPTADYKTNPHTQVLLEWGVGDTVPDDYRAILVPASLPPATPGFWPYTGPGGSFYISGDCDPNSLWCAYKIEQEMQIARHPWGDAEHPRCWGFTVEQLAALDFNAMDLSRWINSMDLGAFENGKADGAIKKAALDTAQDYYSNFKSGATVNSPNAGVVALKANTDTLPMMSAGNYSSYVLKIMVPSNWPQHFPNGMNNNPVTNVRVNWGDGKPEESMTPGAEGISFRGEHDFGEKQPGTYKVVVKLDTAANGPQTLSTQVSITPNDGQMPNKERADFATDGLSGKEQKMVTPSALVNGGSQSEANLPALGGAGMSDLMQMQGDDVTKPVPARSFIPE